MVLVSTHRFSLNKSALKLVNEFIENAYKYRVSVEKSECGATIINAGLNSNGGFRAGEIVTEICLAGCGKASIMPIQYGQLVLPSVFIATDYPALSTLGSQFAGWKIEGEEFSADASGPARALAMEPLDLFQKLQYKEESDVAVLLLEAEKKPPEALIRQVAEKCRVSAESLYLIVFSPNSLTGAIQGCGRVVETGLRKLVQAGLDPLGVKDAWGYAPIPSLHPNPIESKERMNNAIISCGVTHYDVDCDDDRHLRMVVSKAHASALKMLREAQKLAGQNPRYKDLLKESGIDVLKVDADTVAPALVTLSSLKTGFSFSGGIFDFEAIKRSLGTL